MINLRKALISYLKGIHPRVFYQAAPDKAVYPYIVVNFPNSSDDGEFQELFILDIDGWDRTGDTTTLENLMVSINGLNKKTLMADDLAVTFYLDRKLALTDPEPLIKRRKYIYQARLYKRE
ncbi:DUF3168 domain-containing protein [Bacillus sp. ISL-46]|uniref:DUF3168 domain-containing protein n=1 Tax=Bacillus sp. ISL-46 TaxID=2819129 RepID=UPI001BEB3230|nr:DUF3168 domain-containing protein [Bacillus sp. ISL-46]MBT2722314.1 hypothetical protein [Bacillus sp. ISL-46]